MGPTFRQQRREVIFNTPQHILDDMERCRNKYGVPQEFRNTDSNTPQDILDEVERSYKKYGVPVGWLAQEYERIDGPRRADVFNQRHEEHGMGTRKEEEDERSGRRAKVEKRKSTAPLTPISPTNESVAESSKDAAARTPSDSLFIPEDDMEHVYSARDLPVWHTKVSALALSRISKRPRPEQTQAIQALQSMKGCIERCENATRPAELEKLFEELRNHVHKAEITLKVDAVVVRKTNMMTPEYGLPRMFADKFPWDLKADAWQLYNRWYEGSFEVDLMRGIKTRAGVDRNADSIDPAWPHKGDPRYYGQGNLAMGQWWPTQLCALRDGAHGAAQGGIYGEKDKGAYSVVMSSGGYDDVDNGSEVWYSGTEGKDFTPTEVTQRLIETCDRIHQPVRVLRSSQLAKRNIYRPKVGLRYDGLYDVKEKKLLDQEKQKYKFRLVRRKGQYPIRYEDNATGRPTKFELAEDFQLRKNGR